MRACNFFSSSLGVLRREAGERQDKAPAEEEGVGNCLSFFFLSFFLMPVIIASIGGSRANRFEVPHLPLPDVYNPIKSRAGKFK